MARADASGLPATPGTTTGLGNGCASGAGPLDTTSPTDVPGATCAPAPGELLITTPSATVSLGFSVTWPTTSFASEIIARAVASGLPATPGTSTGSGCTTAPLDTTSPTDAPGATCA